MDPDVIAQLSNIFLITFLKSSFLPQHKITSLNTYYVIQHLISSLTVLIKMDLEMDTAEGPG